MNNTNKSVYTIATAHLDTFWLWTYEKTISAFVPLTFKENFRLFERFPEYKFNFEGSHRYELMEEYYPEAFEKLKDYVSKGRWHPCGSCYENGDVNTPSPEALIRNILFGNGYFREKFGVESNDIFLPDCFGFGRALPSIAAHSGLIGFSTQKLTWGGSVDVPFDIGLWKGKDGNGLICALKPGNYVTVAGNFRKNKGVISNLSENTEKYRNPNTFVYHGTGDRGGGPAVRSVKNIVRSMKKNSVSNIKILSSTTKEFFDDIENLHKKGEINLPVYEGELLLTEHGAGSYTSRTVTKRWNRRCELLADAAERFSVAAFTEGRAEYPQSSLDKAWKKVIAHHFHDDITGTSFEECYKRSHNDYVQAMNTFSSEYTATVKAMSELIDTSFVKGVPVIVSNPVQNTGVRKGAVSVSLKSDENLPYVRVFGRNGKEVPSQKSTLADGNICVTFIAEVSSCGIEAYDLRFSSEKSEIISGLKSENNVIENKNLRVTIDEKGDISSVYDKKNGREALNESVKMAILHDVESFHWPAWEVKLADMQRSPYMYPENPVITIEEDGPALCRIRIERKAGKSVFVQKISLDAESNYVSVDNEVDWREEASMLKAEFRTVAANEKAQYDIGLGYTERNTDTERLFEVPAQKWAGITDKKDGFGTAVFSDSRTGWDKPDENTVRLTCIHTPLNNYRWECSQHLMDLGINRFGFAIYPHSGETEKIMAYADEFCQSMHTFITEKHGGSLNGYSAVKISSDKIRISALKKAQDSERIIVRVCEYTGEAQNGAEIEFSRKIKEVYEVRGDEKEIKRLTPTDCKFIFDLKENEIRSFAVTFDEADEFRREDKSVPLPYNAVAITSNSNRDKSTLKDGISVPEELVDKKVLRSGTGYELSDGSLNGLVCKGQKIKIVEGYSAISFIITSLDGDKKALFRVGDREVSVRVQDCFEDVGRWDLMMSRETGYIKPDAQVLSFSHTHNREGDMIAKQMYFFKAELSLDGAEAITLPEDENLLILSATLKKNSLFFEKGDSHFDTLEKRKFDYVFSEYARKASAPSLPEVILDKILDRTYSPTLSAFGGCTKLSLGELYYSIRNISNKINFSSRKKKMLLRKGNNSL